jgi:8-amino-7-oxononanoate synthase
VTGHGAEHEALERELAAFTGRERALLFSTGYMANLAAITTFADRHDMVLMDRLSHASLIDGGLLAKAHFRRYAHGDASAAAREVHASIPSTHAAILATDGVFSMDGDIAPLPELAALAKAYDSWLLVDDAHGLGVLGPTGRGTVEHFGLSADDVPLLMGTLGKAFGSFGAFIAGERDVIELLIQRARSYIYTTALPQPIAAASRAALEIMQREPWRRERTLQLTQRFRSAAKQAALPIMDSITPIQPILIGETEAALIASQKLFDAGFWVTAIRPPTVPKGTSRLRITISAEHSEAQIDALVKALQSVTAT